MPHMWMGQMLWRGSNQKLSCPSTDSSKDVVQPDTLTSPSIRFMLNPCIFFHGKCRGWQSSHLTCPPNQRAKHSLVPSQSQACWWMPSTFDTAHIVTALKYVWARELLWNNNVTYSLFALSDEQWESKGMGCVKQRGCWDFCKKHIQNFDIVDWKCKVEREAPCFILSQGY